LSGAVWFATLMTMRDLRVRTTHWVRIVALAAIVAGAVAAAGCDDGTLRSRADATPTATFAPGNAPGIPPVDGEIVTTESGLRYIDQTVGTGAAASMDRLATIHYSVWLADGTLLETSQGDEPLKVVLGLVVPGMAEGISTMAVGGKRRLIVPAELAYGEEGNPPGIPPNADLLYDIDLIAVD
jgi:peptidylprolyl isomerase